MTLSPETDSAQIYRTDRGRLFGLAYRMTGSATDAEDIVQDAFVRWHGADRADVAAPGAWLTRTVIRICLNRLTSARARHEQPGGVPGDEALDMSLPEPVLTGGGVLGPLDSAERHEAVSLALLVLLQRVTPLERAVFVLREAFVYDYVDIAALLDISEPYARQLLRRARTHLDAGRTRYAAVDSERLVERFLAAARLGALGELEALLAADVQGWSDGGPGRRDHFRGPDQVSRNAIAAITGFAATVEYVLGEVNGEPAVLFIRGGELIGMTVPQVRGELIAAFWTITDPAKLVVAQRQYAAPE